MTEKVLGFKEKDCCDWEKKQYCEVCRQEEYAVPVDKLVPVVSAEFVKGLIAELDQSFVWTSVKSSRDWERVKKIIVARVCAEAGK